VYAALVQDGCVSSWGAIQPLVTPIVTFALGWIVGRIRRFVPVEVQVRAGGERTYFPTPLDETAVSARLKTSPTLDIGDWQRAIFKDLGGIPELSPIVISFANHKRTKVSIVDIRSRVVKRERRSFAVKHQPQYGGPVSIPHLSFDLDQEVSPGLLVDPNSVQGYAPQVMGQRSFLDTQNLDLPANSESVQLIAHPKATSVEVISWVLDYTYTVRNWRNRLVKRTATIDLNGTPMMGVSSAVAATRTIWLR